MSLSADSFAENWEVRQVNLPDGTRMLFISNVAISANGWENVNDDLIVNVLNLPAGTDPTKVMAVAVAYPTSFKIFDKGLIAVDRATVNVVSAPGGTAPVVQFVARLVPQGAILLRVGFQVTVVIAP